MLSYSLRIYWCGKPAHAHISLYITLDICYLHQIICTLIKLLNKNQELQCKVSVTYWSLQNLKHSLVKIVTKQLIWIYLHIFSKESTVTRLQVLSSVGLNRHSQPRVALGLFCGFSTQLHFFNQITSSNFAWFPERSVGLWLQFATTYFHPYFLPIELRF
jgi:hypothetical protein